MEDRTRILNMLKDGTITVEEAEELLRALESNQPAAEPAAVPVAMKDTRGRKAKKLRVQVDAGENERKAKVNINVPISLIKTLGPVIAKNIPMEAKTEMDKHGVDLVAIMESIETLIESGQEEDIVNVDVEGNEAAKVRVYVE